MDLNKLFNEEGIFEWGICSFDKVKDNLLPCRNLSLLPQNAKTIIIALFPYLLSDYPAHNLSKYACISDYHNIVTELLSNIVKSLKTEFPDNRFIAFTDNSPIPEVYAAVSAGLGVMGRHGLLINQKYGSWVFIGEIVTDLSIKTENRDIKKCIQCGNCREHCTGNAIGDSFKKTDCLSFLTQKKGALTGDEMQKIYSGKSVWGCDTCQDVCPMNKQVNINPIKQFTYDIQYNYNPKNNNKHDITDRAYNWRGADILDRNYYIIEKNN